MRLNFKVRNFCATPKTKSQFVADKKTPVYKFTHNFFFLNQKKKFVDKFRKIFKIFGGEIKSTVKITNIGMSEHIAGYKLIFGKKIDKVCCLEG